MGTRKTTAASIVKDGSKRKRITRKATKAMDTTTCTSKTSLETGRKTAQRPPDTPSMGPNTPQNRPSAGQRVAGVSELLGNILERLDASDIRRSRLTSRVFEAQYQETISLRAINFRPSKIPMAPRELVSLTHLSRTGNSDVAFNPEIFNGRSPFEYGGRETFPLHFKPGLFSAIYGHVYLRQGQNGSPPSLRLYLAIHSSRPDSLASAITQLADVNFTEPALPARLGIVFLYEDEKYRDPEGDPTAHALCTYEMHLKACAAATVPFKIAAAFSKDLAHYGRRYTPYEKMTVFPRSEEEIRNCLKDGGLASEVLDLIADSMVAKSGEWRIAYKMPT